MKNNVSAIMKKSSMKIMYIFLSMCFMLSCKRTETKIPVPQTAAPKSIIKKDKPVITIHQENFSSGIRPNEKIKLEKIYTDKVEFIEFNDEGDYFQMHFKRNNEQLSVIYDLVKEKALNFNRGDLIEIKWMLDSIYIAGDGETLDYSEWLIDAKKLKDGSVSLFRLKYNKPIKYTWSEEANFTNGYKDYLYEIVEYYLANSNQELVKLHINNHDSNLTYSIEEGKKEGRVYTILGISNVFEGHSSIIQWLYIDMENRKLYEYDLPNDKLIEFI